MEKPTVAFLIPNRNGMQFLEKCYTSLTSQTHITPEIRLLDQDSTDGSLEFTRDQFPQVIIQEFSTRSETGLGPGDFSYSRCVSDGIRAARADWVVLFNNDAWLAPDWSEHFADYITAHPDRLVLAPVGYFALDPGRIYSYGELVHDGVAHRVGYQQPAHPEDLAAVPEEVTYPSGYCGVYHRSVLKKTGELVDIFDTYFEDVDLGLRGFRMGFRCWLLKKAIVYHVGGASGHFASEVTEAQMRQKCKGAWKSGRNGVWFGKRHYKNIWKVAGLRRRVLRELYNHFKWGVIKGNPVSKARFFGTLKGITTPAPDDYLDRLPAGQDFAPELDRVWEPWKPWMKKWGSI